jgi:L-rhamnono-1,4-lactonase
MKLSGAFNEFAPSVTPSLPKDLIASVKPYFDSVYEMFGAKRLLFASDWPVCNVGGPKGEIEGEERNWSVWRSVVKGWMDGRGLEDEEKDWIWWKSGIEAYGIEGL